ncbi:MAG TPA: methylenetetrahydrofolate reductase [NAD(P)H] [Verrucomicrobiae bacterium]|jgi:methylenetetrahydrofolate reductase (NADPH)|nr:methylenetetrahydrofolate reductase [NAD(P)H] [Verrucomicrobiae bacterium]
MRFIRDIYAERKAAGQPVVSFEFFPPKTDEGERNFFEKTVPALQELRPDFCSVTYGAGGGTRDKTLGIVDRLQREHGIVTMSHLTCVNATVADLRHVLDEAKARGIRNILALRGDPPESKGEFQKTEGGFEFSYQLVKYLKEMGGFGIGTAGFPEGHIACTEGREVDWDRLKAKIDHGADFVLTQLFFDNNDFFRFRDYLAKKGVTVPIFPGIIPILSASQIKRFTAMCGARLPAALVARLEEHAENDEACAQFGIEYATQQSAELLKAGAPGLHFYTLNKARSTVAVVRNLGLARSAA